MKKLLCLLLCLFPVAILFACNGKYDYLSNLTNYYIDITLDDTNYSCECKQKTEYVNNTDSTLSVVKFHLYPNAFRENSKAKVVSVSNETKAYPNGKSYGNINIKSVNIEENVANYSICGEDENILEVVLNSELYPDDKVEIYIEYSLKLPNINHRFGYGDNTINLCNFYPIACVYENGDFDCSLYNSNGDPFYSEVCDYEIKISYTNNLKLASTGNITNIEQKDDKNTAFCSAKCVRDFAIVLSNKFNLCQKEYNNIKLNYYYYDDENSQQTLELINKVIEFFENKIGKYPYSQVSVVKANFVHGGMEYPNCVLISDELPDYENYQMVVIHELIHQWWYGVVGNNQYKYGWIDEGLTEFCTAYFYEEHNEYGKTMDNIITSSTNAYNTFKKVYNDVLGKVDTSMNRSLNEFNTEPEYVYNTYVKGMLMFSTIYELVGKENFDKAMKYYYENNVYKTVNPEIVIKCFSNGSGRNLETLFSSWLNGKVIILNN